MVRRDATKKVCQTTLYDRLHAIRNISILKIAGGLQKPESKGSAQILFVIKFA